MPGTLVMKQNLLFGQVHFGYIYGFGVSGCVAIYLVLNLLAQQGETGGQALSLRQHRATHTRES
jgi:hypothetical protein